MAPAPHGVWRALYLSCRRMNNRTYFKRFTGATTCTTNLMEREPSHEYPHTSWLVDFEVNKKGAGPGVNNEISTGSMVMVGRMVRVKVGIGVLVAGGASVARVLVGACVLTANKSGVFVMASETKVTEGVGEFTTAGAWVEG